MTEYSNYSKERPRSSWLSLTGNGVDPLGVFAMVRQLFWAKAAYLNNILPSNRLIAWCLLQSIRMSPPLPSSTLLAGTIQGLDAMRESLRHGRKVLFVLGAGASVAARIPPMWAVYRDLAQRAGKAAANWKSKGDHERGKEVLNRLAADLERLAENKAARSKAAKALGTLQKAHRSSDPISREISRIWAEFSNAFVEGKIDIGDTGNGLTVSGYSADEVRSIRAHIQQGFSTEDLPCLNEGGFQMPRNKPPKGDLPLPDRQPTGLHQLVAGMLADGKAQVVSLNFDGLTFRALERQKKKTGAVVLPDHTAIRDFYMGGGSEGQGADRLTGIVKIWGDVFHAVCRNPRCPQRDHHTPIFRLKEDAKKQWTSCPVCHAQRQLEIYFTGFEKKEEQTHDTMRELLRFAGPEIGCVVAVGVSGLWDEALVRFIAQLGLNLQREQRLLRERPNGLRPLPAVVCIDPSPSALLRHLASVGVDVAHLAVGAEAWAELFESEGLQLAVPVKPRLESFNGTPMDDGLWDTMVSEEGRLPGAYSYLANPDREQVNADLYLPRFSWLRQLGIKTVVAGMTKQGGAPGLNEADHNRRKHSIGAAHLAARWNEILMKRHAGPLPMDQNTLVTVVLYAAMHHDIGHIPFTHLAEEVFEEVHWTMHPWSDAFHHDEPVLFNLVKDFEKPVSYVLNRAADKLGVNPERLRFWIESAIQGRFGVPWVDGILNSPLDVDKIDYVFRDCSFLGQGLHFVSDGQGAATRQKEKRQEEVLGFMESTVLLPSGLIGLSGPAGVFARHLLEERRWLYKHQYYRPPMRALERIASAIILRWMLEKVGQGQAEEFFGDNARGDDGTPLVVGDTSAMKGRAARDMLWKALEQLKSARSDPEGAQRPPGEPALLLRMIEDLKEAETSANRLNGNMSVALFAKWADAASELFNWAFSKPPPRERLHEELRKRISYSECCYVPHDQLTKVRRIVREIETLRPLRVFFDVAVMPRLLSYPSARRPKWNQKGVLQECFVVPHKDPDRWLTPTDRWIPLSESAFARYDEKRWARLMTVSVWPDDPEIWHALDVFRTIARAQGVEIYENDPDGYK